MDLGFVWIVGTGKKEEENSVMGFFSSILGLSGFGVGISLGLVVGYFFFIYFQPRDVQVSFSLSL